MKDHHLYTVTLEHLEGAKESTIVPSSLTFETRNHENIFEIVEKMKGKIDLDEADSTALAVGLKLFSGVMMRNSDHELFKQFKPHFGKFMKGLKKA